LLPPVMLSYAPIWRGGINAREPVGSLFYWAYAPIWRGGMPPGLRRFGSSDATLRTRLFFCASFFTRCRVFFPYTAIPLQVGLNLFQNQRNPVARSGLKKRCHRNHDLLLRVYINHIAAVSQRGKTPLLFINHPPQKPVCQRIPTAVHSGALRHPSVGYHSPAIPQPPLKAQSTDFRQIRQRNKQPPACCVYPCGSATHPGERWFFIRRNCSSFV